VPPRTYERNPVTREFLFSQLAPRLMTQAWVGHVADTTEVDLRAHRVALTYHYYCRELDRFINGDDSFWSLIAEQKNICVTNATWFNFGTWATITINRDLILGRTPAGPNRLLPSAVRRLLTPLLLHLRAADGQRVSRALSWGQRLVFISTTMIFQAWRTAGTEPAAAIKTSTFDEILKLATWGGQRYLDRYRHLDAIWTAFQHYGHARDARTRLRAAERDKDPVDLRRQLRQAVARHVLTGNILITAIEQDIVDDAVREVIDHIPRLAAASATSNVARWAARYSDVPRQITSLNLPFQLGPATEGMTTTWARFMTDQILVMMFPTETLRMGLDIPPADVAQPYFQPDLACLTSSVEGQDAGSRQFLTRLVSQFDRTLDEGWGSAAHDWRRYDDRMNWAVTMLRSRQQVPALFWAPYSEEDQRRIIRGELPHRGGDPSAYEVAAPVDGLPSWNWL